MITSDHVAVFQLLDNMASHVMTTEDTVIPCCKDSQGRYHVDIIHAPPELLTLFLRNCVQVINVINAILDNVKLILVPMPCYLTASCCGSLEHMPTR
jgi:hypothetical protein